MGFNFSIAARLITCAKAGVGLVAAKAYGACMGQAVVFSSVNMLVSRILRLLIGSYLQNTRQLALADITIQVTSGLAGVLMTRLFCEKTIGWKQALASSVISDAAVFNACRLWMQPIPLPSFADIMKQTNPV